MKAWTIVAALAAGPMGALAQDANLARNLAATCANCHDTNGNVRCGLGRAVACKAGRRRWPLQVRAGASTF